MAETLADKLEAFARDAANAMPNGTYMFLRQTLGGCVCRNIGEIVAALREREERFARGIGGPSPEQEVKHLAEQCATLLAENERLRTDPRAVLAQAVAQYKGERYDEITKELSAVTHGLLDIIRGPNRTEVNEQAQRAHKLVLRLLSLAFPKEGLSRNVTP
jgi:hypothetical protein